MYNFSYYVRYCNNSLSRTQYCPLLIPPSHTSQEVTDPGAIIVEERLTAKF